MEGFQGFLKDRDNRDHRQLKDRDQWAKKPIRSATKVDADKGPPKKVPAVEVQTKPKLVSEVPSRNYDGQPSYSRYSDTVRQMASSFLDEGNASLPDAASEKELGNEYFKQKKFLEAVDCYSRSIALSPTSVAFANRAMAYLKVKRYEEAENDCTEALNLYDRYVKAYSRRATARKELGKLKASLEDSEFAMRLEPNNPDLRKQYTETRALLGKESSMKVHGKPLISVNDRDNRGPSAGGNTKEPLLNGSKTSSDETSKKHPGINHHKHDLEPSVQDLASRAASLVMSTAAKNVKTPKSAYELEVSWRALSNDCAKQAQLLKTIPPATLPQIFKNALSAPMLIEVVRCTTTFFREDTETAVGILDNLAKVPRFDMIVMCLPSVDRSELHQMWEEVFSSKSIQADHMEAVSRLRSKYCTGEWQAHIH